LKLTHSFINEVFTPLSFPQFWRKSFSAGKLVNDCFLPKAEIQSGELRLGMRKEEANNAMAITQYR